MSGLLKRAIDLIDGWIHWQREEIYFYKDLFSNVLESVIDENERQQIKRDFERAIKDLKYESKRFVKSMAFSILVTLFFSIIDGIKSTVACFIFLFANPYLLMIIQSDRNGRFPIDRISEKVLRRKAYADAVWAITLAIVLVGSLFYRLYYWGEGEPGYP